MIRNQYDEMIKYATALRLGTAETEAILRRFTKKNVQYPTYKALVELGKAIKTIFLPIPPTEELRREINEGLNVVEQWNGATDFIFFARRSELSRNRREDHEIRVLALHLIQNCMIYINTLMIQKVLSQQHWQGRLTPRDYAADAIDLGTRQSVRTIRPRHEHETGLAVIEMAACFMSVGSPGRVSAPPSHSEPVRLSSNMTSDILGTWMHVFLERPYRYLPPTHASAINHGHDVSVLRGSALRLPATSQRTRPALLEQGMPLAARA